MLATKLDEGVHEALAQRRQELVALAVFCNEPLKALGIRLADLLDLEALGHHAL